MMNTKLYAILLAFVLGTLLVGCSDVEELPTIENNQKVTFIAQQESFSSKASRSAIYEGPETEGRFIFMQWEPNDQIGAFSIDPAGNRHDVNFPFTYNGKENANTAEFDGRLMYIKPGHKICAYYPYTPHIAGDVTLYVNIPQYFKYKNLSSLAPYDFKVADNVSRDPGTYPSQDEFASYTLKGTFKQMTSLLRFNVNLPEIVETVKRYDATADLSQCTFNEIKLSIKDKNTGDYVPLTGTFTCDLNNINQGLSLQGFDSKKENSLFVAMDSPVAITEKDLTFYALVAPGQTLGKKLTCDLTFDNGKVKYTLQFATDMLVNFQASQFYHMGINQSSINRAEKLYGTEVKVIKNEVSTEETANCYMISTLGTHKFNANVIGNGQKGIIPNAGFHTNNASIHPVSAKLLWQDTENFVSDITLLNDGWVQYKANKTVGNAVIAVYDNVNGTGNVLWSWHIWGTGDEPVADMELINNASYRFTVMDRPLGAHSKTSCTATLYQWGRKDAFPNVSFYTEEGSVNSIPFKNYPANTLAIEEMIKQPATLMEVNGAPFVVNNLQLWGDGFRNVTRTDDNRADNRWLYGKTIYDPSPVGYRVANMFTFTGFVTMGTGYTNYVPDTNLIRDRYDEPIVPANAHGYSFKCNDTDEVGIFVPFCGHRKADGTMYAYETHCDYWTTGCKTKKGYPNRMQTGKPNHTAWGDKYDFQIFQRYTSDYFNDDACAIRCVREDNNLVINK